jgi:hypothetical protein
MVVIQGCLQGESMLAGIFEPQSTVEANPIVSSVMSSMNFWAYMLGQCLALSRGLQDSPRETRLA